MPIEAPAELMPVFQKFLTVEYATMTAAGAPLTYPVTPYTGEKTLDVSTGLSYPLKAERARRNPKVCLLYSYPRGSGLDNPPTVLVYGHAAVRDANLQANTDRYVRYVAPNMPLPPFILRTMNWYFSRIWVEITPLKALWWERGNLDSQPQRWEAPPTVQRPASDPAPATASPPGWKGDPPSDWRPGASYALQNLGTPVLTVVDADGYPVPFRVRKVELVDDGFRVIMPQGAPVQPQGKACLTFHAHPETFTGQENMVFAGSMNSDRFQVEKRLGDWSLPPKGLGVVISLFGNGFKLRPHVKAEAARRGQPVPRVNLPKST